MNRMSFLLALVPLATLAQTHAPTIGPTPLALQVTVNLTGSPLTGTCGYPITLSWSAANASTCSKTGAWGPGTAPASGSETVNVNSATATYTLSCSSSTDTRTITWVNPTQNVDGSAVTLSGNKVFHSNAASTIESQNLPIVLTPARTTYLLTGLPAGPRVVGVKATGPTPGVLDSAMSALATTTIVLPTGADTVQATCTPPPEPRPPTAITIASTVWEIIQTGTAQKVGRDVGLIDLDITCLGEAPLLTQGLEGEIEYWGVPKDLVRLYRKPKSKVLLGRCQVVPIV